MHTVELLEQAIALAGQRGFVVRQEWLGGSAAGACEFKGRHWIFLDLAESPSERLEKVLEALGRTSYPAQISNYPELLNLLKMRRAA